MSIDAYHIVSRDLHHRTIVYFIVNQPWELDRGSFVKRLANAESKLHGVIERRIGRGEDEPGTRGFH
jgi:hypothetical protein